MVCGLALAAIISVVAVVVAGSTPTRFPPGGRASGPPGGGSARVGHSALVPPGMPYAEAPTPSGTSAWQPSSLPPNAKAIEVPILMYHYVDVRPPVRGPWAAPLTVSTASFRAQMDYLTRAGYHTLTLEQIYRCMAGREQLPAKPVALTFDDGGLDNYTVALPILRAHHFTATFFVITAAVGKRGYMTWGDLKEMSKFGMAIDSHTVHHHFLRSLTDTSLKAELVGSRATLMAKLGLDTKFLAYPDGGSDERVMAATEAAGYLAAVTDKPGSAGDTLYPVAAYNWPREGISASDGLAGLERALGAASSARAAPSA